MADPRPFESGELPCLPLALDPTQPEDLKLLSDALTEKYSKAEAVALKVNPTVRLGGTRARVYRVRAKLAEGEAHTTFCYAKIAPEEDLVPEFNAWQSLVDQKLANAPRATFSEKSVTIKSPGQTVSEKYRCLCFDEAGELDDGAQPVPLHETINDTSEVNIPKIIGSIYDSMKRWEQSGKLGVIQWSSHYDLAPPGGKTGYLRWGRTKTKAKEWLGENAMAEQKILFHGRELWSPLYAVQQIERSKLSAQVKIRPVHGDLHPNNIIIEKVGQESKPWIIDFGWTRRFHALVDYSLLEASLKIFNYSRFFSEERYLVLHDLLALFDKTEDAPARKKAKNNAKLSNQETIVFDILQSIRQRAKAETQDWPHEYYLSSLLVSIGQLPLWRSAMPRATLLTGAWFATNLMEAGKIPSAKGLPSKGRPAKRHPGSR